MTILENLGGDTGPSAVAAGGACAPPRESGSWGENAWLGFVVFYITTLPFALGLLMGIEMLVPATPWLREKAETRLWRGLYQMGSYLVIARDGYPPALSTSPILTAYFPVYPLLGWGLHTLTGMSLEVSLLLLSHVAFCISLILLSHYMGKRWPEGGVAGRGLVLLLLGLWPMGLYFRLPYTESLFLLVLLVLLVGWVRGWPLWCLAVVSGLASAVRPVGVVLSAVVLAKALWEGSGPWRWRLGRAVVLAPLATGGLLAYMGYQYERYGTPWTFVTAQEHFVMGMPRERSWWAKGWALATAEPIWGVYMTSSPRYWALHSQHADPLFSVSFWDPIFFVGAGLLLGWGWWRRWLLWYEGLLGLGLLAMPYVARAYEMSMGSQGRFATVVVFSYIVMGRWLSQCSGIVALGIVALLAAGQCVFVALYIAGHFVAV